MNPFRVLIIDDEDVIRRELGEFLADAGFEILEAATPSRAFSVLDAQKVDVAILDVRLPEMDGIEVLRRLKSESPELEVIMMTGHGDMETVVAALRLGASDFFKKPIEGPEVLAAIERTKRFLLLQGQVRTLEANYAGLSGEVVKQVGEIVGASAAMRRVVDLALRAAKSPDTGVIITGESGTGKELLARVLHFASTRGDRPFLAVNCAAIPETLVESEFFGHKKGAFTGAHEDAAGYFENAQGGTLFLDEIGDLSLPAQSKLLRVLETRVVRRIGGSRDLPVEFRVVCATHRNLLQRVKEGQFREDLYYRLATLELQVPPLRERMEDLPALLEFYVKAFAARLARPVPAIDAAVAPSLAPYPFPGNIRELKNMVERAVILCEGDRLLPEHFSHPPAAPLASAEIAPEGELSGDLAAKESRALSEALRACDFNKTQAAKRLGITIFSLLRKMKKHGLEVDKRL
ncbi:MAG: sigma-54-dependent Fis family transcriptional regulator [Spirochaetes bacterium]|nr:sigma-54-dependent Fis family transcriptional regulator [Spirochaetota bacterium]